jgi:hypothetical protein
MPSIGVVVPCIGHFAAVACLCADRVECDFAAVGFLCAVPFLEVPFFFAVAACFFAAGFFAADFAGIGMVMPGIRICAIAGAETIASTSALAATNKVDFTTNSPKGEAPL